jgi:hypothetical protein
MSEGAGDRVDVRVEETRDPTKLSVAADLGTGSEAVGEPGIGSSMSRDGEMARAETTTPCMGYEPKAEACRGGGRPTSMDGISTCTTGCMLETTSALGVRSSKRMQCPVPAPWLASKDGAYAVSINWLAESKDDSVAGGLDEKGKLAKLNTMPIEDDISRDINSIRRNMETDTFDPKYRM